ncbi:uncharacterized protein LOC104909025 isoform X2 [Beta vulgaris subsp. vulgaris]|uniref:uncharacterized protein LOC104909025 isoform X2 n=1 Tax=Beta vulgaris subsp. vulgaris TaxID=3555 RepID=UPI00254951A5|nr:uncharacterized protein LOC104909025 isoform X2 [Beta vulgaris subsp. vulgaris]
MFFINLLTHKNTCTEIKRTRYSELSKDDIKDIRRGLLLSCNQGGSSTSQPEEVKRLPGGKVKKKDRKEVVIEKVVRNKRKCITTVKGLELFGVKLSDASKKLGKKFATGASVVKGPTEKEQIDVQGDIAYDIVEFLTDTWPDVPESAIFFIEDGKKVPAA